MRFVYDAEVSVYDAFHRRGFAEGQAPGGQEFVYWLEKELAQRGYEVQRSLSHLDYIREVWLDDKLVLEAVPHQPVQIYDRKLRRFLSRVDRKTFRVSAWLFEEVK